MLVGEIARATGTKPSAIRFYERRGLLPRPRRSPAGYRHYGPDVLSRIEFIQAGQKVGFTLAELRDIIALRDEGTAPCAHVLDLMESHRMQIADQIEQLHSVEKELLRLLRRGRRLDPAACGDQDVCQVVRG